MVDLITCEKFILCSPTSHSYVNFINKRIKYLTSNKFLWNIPITNSRFVQSLANIFFLGMSSLCGHVSRKSVLRPFKIVFFTSKKVHVCWYACIIITLKRKNLVSNAKNSKWNKQLIHRTANRSFNSWSCKLYKTVEIWLFSALRMLYLK